MAKQASTKSLRSKASKQPVVHAEPPHPPQSSSSAKKQKREKKRSREEDAEGDDEDAISAHKKELEELRQTDPEFYAFLNANDEGLLHFGEGDDGDELDDNDGDDGDDKNEREEEAGSEVQSEYEDVDSEDEEDAQQAVHRAPVEVTLDLFESCKSSALHGSMRETRRLVGMFRAACQPPRDADNEDDDDDNGNYQSGFVIFDPNVFQEVLSSSIECLHIAMARQLNLKDDLLLATRDQLTSLPSHKRWRKMQPLVLGFFKSFSQLLNSVCLLPKHVQMTSFLLNALHQYAPLLTALPRMSKSVVKVLLNVWAQSGSVALENYAELQRLRDLAFRVVLRLAQCAPGGVAEDTFRAVYLKFARRCKSVSEFNITLVHYWIKCVVVLYRRDVALAYQQAFVYIRQLAMHVRAAFVKKGEAVMKPLRSWQFISCLRLWASVICSEPSENKGLGMLVYPLSQAMFAVMSLLPSVYYCPLRLHLLSAMQQLAAHCRLFLPTCLPLCEMLQYDVLFERAQPSTDLPPKLSVLLAFPSNSLEKVVVRDALVQEVLRLLHVEAELYRFHVSCAEYFYLPLKKLRAFSKRCKTGKWREQVRSVMQRMQQYSQACRAQREAKLLTPMSAKEFESLRLDTAANVVARVQPLMAQVLPSASEVAEMRKAAAKRTRNEDEEDEEEEDGSVGPSNDDESDEASDEEDEEDDDDDDDEEEESRGRGKGPRSRQKAPVKKAAKGTKRGDQGRHQGKARGKEPAPRGPAGKRVQYKPSRPLAVQPDPSRSNEKDEVKSLSWKSSKNFWN